jgi:hypothetical protein
VLRHKESMLKDRVSEWVSAAPRIVSVTMGATLARASTRRGDITEVPTCTSVIRIAGVTATEID